MREEKEGKKGGEGAPLQVLSTVVGERRKGKGRGRSCLNLIDIPTARQVERKEGGKKKTQKKGKRKGRVPHITYSFRFPGADRGEKRKGKRKRGHFAYSPFFLRPSSKRQRKGERKKAAHFRSPPRKRGRRGRKGKKSDRLSRCAHQQGKKRNGEKGGGGGGRAQQQPT